MGRGIMVGSVTPPLLAPFRAKDPLNSSAFQEHRNIWLGPAVNQTSRREGLSALRYARGMGLSRTHRR